MKRAIAILAACCAISINCSDDSSDENQLNFLLSAAVAGVFTNFCGAATQYSAGSNSVPLSADAPHWIAFPFESGQSYELTVNEGVGQNALIAEIGCRSGLTNDGVPVGSIFCNWHLDSLFGGL